MASAGVSQRAARWSVQHPWRVMLGWLLLVVAGALVFQQGNERLRADVKLLDQSPSVQASNLIRDRLSGAPVTTSIFCADGDPAAPLPGQGAPSVAVALPALTETIRTCLASDHSASSDPAASWGSHSTAGARLLGRLNLLETPKETAIAFLRAIETVSDRRDAEQPVEHRLTSRLNERVIGAARADLHQADRSGILVATVFLILLTRALIAPLLSMMLSLAAVAAALGVTLALSRVMPFSLYVVNIIVMFGLAVGIDYSLVVLHRYREERRRAADVETAIERTAETAGRTVLLAGSAAILSLSGLLFIPISIFRSLALGAMVVMGMGLLASLTLLPAALRLIGDRLDWPRTPASAGRRAASTPEAGDGTSRPGFLALPHREGRAGAGAASGVPAGGVWASFSRRIMARPALAILFALALLTPLIVQASALQPGLSLPQLSTDSAAEEPAPSWEVRTVDFATHLFGVVEIVVDTDRSAAVDQRLETLAASIGGSGAFSPVIMVQWNADNDLAVMSALLAERPDGQAAIEAVRDLQRNLIPEVFAEPDTSVVVGGAPSSQSDVLHVIEVWQWRVAGLVLLLSFSLLLIAFRSIAVPVKATLMNLLSTAAALGAVVLVFQKGIGASLLGFEQTSSIEAWVPLLLFCVLVGLSTDYHLFLLGRVREFYLRSGDNRSAVAAGVESTGSIITGAALVMVTVFASFASGTLVSLQQLGFGLAVAVLIDATIIRSVLAPAMMALLGRWNWYLPAWLGWLPKVGYGPVAGSPMSVPGSMHRLG